LTSSSLLIVAIYLVYLLLICLSTTLPVPIFLDRKQFAHSYWPIHSILVILNEWYLNLNKSIDQLIHSKIELSELILKVVRIMAMSWNLSYHSCRNVWAQIQDWFHFLQLKLQNERKAHLYYSIYLADWLLAQNQHIPWKIYCN
jgi:hypothetical protein